MGEGGHGQPAFRFEKLGIWQKSIEYADAVYDATEAFPAKERFGLTSQLRRAAASVSANIAEGSSRASDRDFSRFVEIAFGSLCESISHLCLARRRTMVSDKDYSHLYGAAQELSKMLSSFGNTLGQWK